MRARPYFSSHFEKYDNELVYLPGPENNFLCANLTLYVGHLHVCFQNWTGIYLGCDLGGPFLSNRLIYAYLKTLVCSWDIWSDLRINFGALFFSYRKHIYAFEIKIELNCICDVKQGSLFTKTLV